MAEICASARTVLTESAAMWNALEMACVVIRPATVDSKDIEEKLAMCFAVRDG